MMDYDISDMYYKSIFTGFLVLICIGFLDAQEAEWELKRSTKNLQIYTRNISESGIKELKITTQFETSLNSIIALLNDVPANSEWVYSSKLAKITEQIAPNDLYYYSVSDFPWPLQDRDIIVHSIVAQDTESKVVTSTSYSVAEQYPLQKGLVRVSIFDSKWTFTPLPDGKVNVEYTVKTDPGGNIPIFLTNMFIDRGPVATMKKMRKMLELPKYRDAKVGFIEEL